MKIGIVTIIDFNNYGNRLQNYATQEILKSFNHEVITILNTPKRINYRNNSISFSNVILNFLSRIRKLFFPRKVERLINKANKNRFTALSKFSRRFINLSDFIAIEGVMPEIKIRSFDLFITGSDQIWNPYFRFGSSFDFLDFTSKNRISFSSSFGIDEIPIEYVEKYKFYLKNFKYISVREHEGALIVKKLINISPIVLLDPTLLLEIEHWNNFREESLYKPKSAYILTYFLGKKPKSLDLFLNKIRTNSKYKIIELNSLNHFNLYSISPNEFIDLIASSSLVFTDSFHGLAFSIIFKRPFFICNRITDGPPMDSRINSILNLFKFENRRWKDEIDPNSLFDIDFSNNQNILALERRKCTEYLNEIFNNSLFK